MDISRVDLNLLVYLDVLLREHNVTKAANHLGITQPAMSNGLRRLRDLFGDPLLVRTSEGMTATERARELQPLVRGILSNIEQAVQEKTPFAAHDSQRVFRIMASDYAESCLMPRVLRRIRQEAPHVTLDVLTPSDVSFLDVEQGTRGNKGLGFLPDPHVISDAARASIDYTRDVFASLSMYSTFAAELSQPPVRQLTFSHVRHCSPDYTVDSMYIARTTHGNHARTQMVLRNQDSFDQTANVVLRGKEFCVELR